MMYIHIQVVPPSQTILRSAFEGVAYQYKVLPFGLSLAPLLLHGCGSLPSATDGNPHTQLSRRLAHSGPVAGSFNITQDPPPKPCGLLQGRYCPSAQNFPKNAGLYGSGFTGTSVGSASHATHPVLAETEGSIRGLASRTPTMLSPQSPSRPVGTQASQGTTAKADSNSPALEEPTVGVGVIPAAESSPMADPLEMGPSLSSERHDMASTARVMGPACVAARREPFVLPERVLNTMAEASAPSSRAVITA